MKKILLLDDNEDAIVLQSVILESDGFVVETGMNGKEGLEKLKTFRPDIIVSDVLMPQMDGFQFCRAVKSDENLKDIPVVFYSAQYTEEEDRALAESVGAEGFIYKPIGMEEFLKIINRILEQDQKRKTRHTPDEGFTEFDQKHYEVQAKMLDKKLRELEEEHTKLQASEEQLRRINDHLVELVKEESASIIEKEKLLMQQSKMAAMGEMVSMIAHQWRQPLNSVSAAAIKLNVLNELGTLTPGELTGTLKFIQEMLQKMSMTINDFMEFVKPDREREHFLIREIVHDISRMIGPQLTTHDIMMKVDVDEEAAMVGYKQELAHVLLNILANAREAFEDQEHHDKTITLRGYEEEGRIILKVSDNAGGIDPMILNRVFEPFFTTKSTEQGTGLGLYMSKKIIEEHFKGSIGVTNLADGAEFTIEVPK